jgi:hypothetical protein
MKTRFTILLPLIVGLLSAKEPDEPRKYPKLLDYTNVVITKISADSINIIHQDGATKIPFEKLPDEVRADLGLSKESVEKHREDAKNEAESRKLENAASQVLFSRVSGKVLQVLDGGVLVTDAKQWLGTMKKDTYFDTSEYAHITLHTSYELPIDLCFVACDTSSIVDGQTFTKIVAATGNYSYVSTLNVRKTCVAFTTDIVGACKTNTLTKDLSSDNILKITSDRLDASKMFYQTKVPYEHKKQKR